MKPTAIIAIIVVIALIVGFVSLRKVKRPIPTTTTTVISQPTTTTTTMPTTTEELSMEDALEDFGGLSDGVLDIPTDTEVIVGELETETFELTL